MSTISASTTLTTAYSVTGDTTGTLVFKTGASPTTAMTLGADQSVTFAGTPTYSGGTANGVAYLNASKVFTTGSALVFDGTNLGIGTTSPAYKLDVAGHANIKSAFALFWRNSDNTNWVDIYNAGASGTNLGQMAFETGGSERMRLDASGRWMVGNTTGESKANVFSGGSNGFSSGTLPPGMTIYGTTTDGYGSMLSFKANPGAQGVSGIGSFRVSGYQTDLRFYTNDTNNGDAFTERARIDPSGNLLVGTTSVNNLSKFTFDAGSSRGGIFVNTAGGAHTLEVLNNNGSYADLGGGILYVSCGGTAETSYRAISVYSPSGARFAVRGDGTIYSTNTSVQSISDVRFKENIRPLDSGISQVMQLQPRRFDWKEGRGTGEKNVAGFIAQEMETVFPELVSEFQDGIEDTTMYKSVGYGGLVPTLVKAIQEQQAIIEQLRADVETLKGAE